MISVKSLRLIVLTWLKVRFTMCGLWGPAAEDEVKSHTGRQVQRDQSLLFPTISVCEWETGTPSHDPGTKDETRPEKDLLQSSTRRFCWASYQEKRLKTQVNHLKRLTRWLGRMANGWKKEENECQSMITCDRRLHHLSPSSISWLE